MTDGRTDRRTDRRTDGRTDGGDCNIPDAFLKKRGDNKRYDPDIMSTLKHCLRADSSRNHLVPKLILLDRSSL